jgi:threonine aldolase
MAVQTLPAGPEAVAIARGLKGEFYSDTKTLPTQGMREAVFQAEVGDEQKNEDPSVNTLCERVAELLGKEAAIYMPSGTMCNEVAVAVHCQHGDELICGRLSHIVEAEGGAPAAIAGVLARPLDGEGGMFTAEQVSASLRPVNNNYQPNTGLVAVEQTANLAGGTVWPLEQLNAVADVAHDAGVPTHMDGARLLNAVVKTGIPASDYAEGYDSVWLDFTKGLGALMGGVLAGGEEFITRVRRKRQMMGGGFRQIGMMAAACTYALDHHVDRLADDHARAERIADALAGLAKVEQVLPGGTNIVIFEIDPSGPTAAELVAELMTRGFRIGEFGPRRARIVTHLNVDDEATSGLLAELADILG